MADQKYNTAPRSAEDISGLSISEPLFDGEPLDLEVHGGLVVLDNGQVAEVTPVKFIPEGGDTSLDGQRIQPLPFDVIDTGEDRVITWRDHPYDPRTPTIGVETESLTMEASNAHWWDISPDGRTIQYPHGLAVEPADKRGHQPELLKNTTESGSPVENLSRGHNEFAGNVTREKYGKQVWMIQNGLVSVPLSIYTESVREQDITDHPYPQMLKRLMPHVLEYASCLSEQINIQWKDPEAAAFAINAYELLGPVLGLVTAASPARDGSLYTTLSQHYEHNPDFKNAGNAEDYRELAGLVRRELGPFMDRVPYDWRELARGYGSPAGGVIARPAPIDVESFLREGDRQLRASEAMTVNRVLGPHANRWRPDKNVIEISNLSLGGGHPDKMSAAEETVIKATIALQEYFDSQDADFNYEESWAGIIPWPQERRDMTSRQRVVDVARINTMIFSVFGKDRNMLDANYQERRPREIFNAFASFISRYAPEPLSTETVNEVLATLEQPPQFAPPQTIYEPIARFFGRSSSLTATEALRLAEPLDDMNPPITLNQLIRRFAERASQKRMERVDAKQRKEAAGTDTVSGQEC